jgi:hypothetical protein
MKLIDDLGLEIFKMSESKRIGFWNEANQELFLETSEYSIITILKLIWRYGLGNIFGMISTV